MAYANYSERMVPVFGQPPPVPEAPLYPDTLSESWGGLCPSVAPKGLGVMRTRDEDHTGFHEAGAGQGVAARWDDDRTTDHRPPTPPAAPVSWKERLRGWFN